MPIIRNTYHSAETNEIVGKIPPWIIRRGNTVIFMTFAALLVISFFITYQDKVPATATMYYADNKFKVTALIPSKGFGKIEIGQKVIIKPDCYRNCLRNRHPSARRRISDRHRRLRNDYQLRQAHQAYRRNDCQH